MDALEKAAARRKSEALFEKHIVALIKSIGVTEKSCAGNGRGGRSNLQRVIITDKNGVSRPYWVNANKESQDGHHRANGKGQKGKERKAKVGERNEKPRKGPLPILSKKELHDFIEKHKTSKIDERVSLGPISNEARERIKAAAHVDVERVILDSGSIRHAFGKPGHNLDSNDLDDMKEIIETTRDITVSPDKNRQGNPVIIFRKEEPNGLFLCEEYRAKKKELELQTAYRIKKNRQLPGAEKQPPANVRNVTASSDNVSQANGAVNKNPKKAKKISKSKKWLWVDSNGKIWTRKSVLEAWRRGMAGGL